MTDNSRQTDVLVIGGGPGGYVAAIRAGQLGLDTTLVEMDGVGGTCLNYGCIPSKAMLTAGDVYHEAQSSEEMGIYANPSVEFDELVDWKDGIVSQLTGGVGSLCRANGVEVVEGRAEFTDEHTVSVFAGPDDDDPSTIEFEHAIVATGSSPIEVPGFEYADDPIIDSRQALALDDAPDSLLVVGAGYIGMELSTAFAKLGTDVTVVEMLDSVLPAYENDLSDPVHARADDLDIEFRFGQVAEEWHYSGYEGVTVTTAPVETEEAAVEADGSGVEKFDVEKVLVAVGRRPVTETVGLDAVGIDTTDNGFVETDENLQTEHDHIYAIGDVAGEPMLAHKASAEGQLVAEHIAGDTDDVSIGTVPAAVFTEPEIATVGRTEDEAEAEGFEPVVGEFPFAASGRSLTTGHDDGFIRIIADEDTGRVLGGRIVGPEASELVAEVTLAVETEATLEDVATTIHTHPTLAEAVMEAAEHALGHAIHTSN